MTTRSLRYAASPAVALAVLMLAGADDATKPIKAGELSFDVPASWKAERPSSQMRKAQLKVAPVGGDSEPAEVLFVFPNGAAGTVKANIARWEQQFVGDGGKPAKAEVKETKGKNVDATRVEVSGAIRRRRHPRGRGEERQARLPPPGGDRPDARRRLFLLQDGRPRQDDEGRPRRVRRDDRLDDQGVIAAGRPTSASPPSPPSGR